MAAKPFRQSSFAAGELAPSFYGRTESPRYGRGLRVCRDAIITKHGDWLSRPGSRFVGLANSNQINIAPPNQGAVEVIQGLRPRLIPFYFSDTDGKQNAVLEFGEQYFSVWVEGQRVFNTYYNSLYGSSPYHAADLYKIRYVQSGDILFLACAGYDPLILERQDAGRWSLSAMDFSKTAAAISPVLDLDATSLDVVATNTGTPTDGTIPEAWQWMVTAITKNETGQVSESLGVLVGTGGGFYLTGAADFDPVAVYSKNWLAKYLGVYYVSLVGSNNGNYPNTSPTQWQSIDQSITTAATLALSTVRNVAITMYSGTVPAQYLPTNPNFVTFRVYRGRNGIFGWVGDSNQATFIDHGAAPDYAEQPPKGTNPFNVYDGSGNLLRTEQPISVAFFEDRLTFFGTEERPAEVFTSAVGDYFNFDQPLLPTDADSVLFTLAARRRELARWALGKDKLFLGTDGQVWTASGSGGPLTPSSIDAHVQSDIGSAWAAPTIVGNKLLFVRDKGTAARAIEFDFSRGTYPAEDVSFAAEHFFLGHQIIEWCYADDPWAQVWAVREDGVLLSGVYCPDEQMWAWAAHELCLDANNVPQQAISVCTIPEDGYDAVYVALADEGGGPAWIVRLGSRLELDDEATETAGESGGGLEFDIGDGIGETEAGAAVAVGEVGTGTPICLDAWIKSSGPFTSGPTGIFTFHGINYLANRNVYVIVDGIIYGPTTVASNGDVGVITGTGTTETASLVYIGLGYSPEGEALDLAVAREKQKNVSRVSLEVKSNGQFWAGADFSHLDPVSPPVASAGTSDDDLARATISSKFTKAGRVCWRQVLPLPLTVRAVTREVDIGSM
ncbi:MAG: hypothetical protein JST54_12525 [Deltaproteobacteria bacterium]|nr:hypothetical protein [Deltaproteobacteria bacterium]